MTSCFKKTKIIATLGPASRSLDIISDLIVNGTDIFRINFSHGTYDEHTQTFNLIKEACLKTNKSVGILGDLQGPKIRTGKTYQDIPVFLKTGNTVTITEKNILNTEKTISIQFPGILKDISKDQTILINDGAIRLSVLSKNSKNTLTCLVSSGGVYSSHKGVNLPGISLSIPSLTEKDKQDLAFMVSMGAHFVALSFVRKKEDIEQLEKEIKKLKAKIKVIAKIEKPEATENISGILDACDGIMVARGDLGIETSYNLVPVLQKELISFANKKGKSVIVATQMLESMIENEIPTRAESTDVANAIIDGTDCVMLSGETAIGKNPGLVVKTMAQIARTTEKSEFINRDIINYTSKKKSPMRAVCEAAAWASKDLGNIPVLVFTITGKTAFLLSKIRYQAPIFAFSPNPEVVSQLSLAWNTNSFQIQVAEKPGIAIKQAEELLTKKGFTHKNQTILIVGGTSPVQGSTNFLRVKKVGEM